MLIGRFKPEASLKTRIFLAALLWSCIGLMLMGRGGYAVFGTGWEWLLPVALLTGTFKSWAVLDRVAVKNMTRILEKGEYSCLGGIYSWKTWLLVLAMILCGRLLRMSSAPLWLVGFIYATVGWSLCWSSRKVWQRLRDMPAPAILEAGDEHCDGER
jgi:hypothetical protein